MPSLATPSGVSAEPATLSSSGSSDAEHQATSLYYGSTAVVFFFGGFFAYLLLPRRIRKRFCKADPRRFVRKDSRRVVTTTQEQTHVEQNPARTKLLVAKQSSLKDFLGKMIPGVLSLETLLCLLSPAYSILIYYFFFFFRPRFRHVNRFFHHFTSYRCGEACSRQLRVAPNRSFGSRHNQWTRAVL